MSSEESLNRIFNILETMVSEKEDKAKKKDDKTDKTLIDLLQGIVDTAKEKEAGTAAGKQLEDLAKGLNAFKDIDHEKIDSVATTIKNINKIFNELSVNDNVSDNISNLISTIDELSSFSTELSKKLVDFIKGFQLENQEEHIKNTQVIIGIITALNKLASTDLSKLEDNLENLDPDVGENIGKFINSLVSSLEKSMKKLSPNDIQKLIEPIGNLFYGLSSIVNTNIFSLKISLNPIKGYLLGRQIGQFLHEIMKRIKDDHINESIKDIGSVLSPLSSFITADIEKIKKILSKRNAKRLATFFTTLIAEIPQKKELKETMEGVSTVLTTLTSISLVKIITFNILVKSLSEEKAKKINAFIKALTEGEWNAKKLKDVNEFMISWNKVLTTVIAGLVVISLLVTVLSPIAVLTGMFIIGLSIWFMKNTILSLVTGISNKKIKDAHKFLISFAKLIGMTISVMAVIAILTKVIGIIPVLTGFLLINLTIKHMGNIILQLSDKKFNRNIKHVTELVKGIGLLILTFVAGISILAIVTNIVKPKNIIIALGVIALFMTGAYFMIKKLSNIKARQLKQATKALVDISICFAIIAFVSAYLLRPIAKHVSDVVIGGAVVLGIITLMIGGLFLISRIKNKNLKQARRTLIVLTAIFATISVIAAYLLPEIAKHGEDATIGGIIALGILGLLIGGLYLITKISNRKSNKALKTLVILALVYTGIALIAAFILPMIGKHATDAIQGGVITIAILSALIFGVHVLTTLKQKKMIKSLMYIAILTLIYGAISIIALTLLIPIGQNGLEALAGGVITIAILAALIFGVWFISKIDVDTLAWGLLATVGLAVIYTGIALMVKAILIPIGKQAKAAMFGAVITLLIMTGLLLGVKELSLLHVTKSLFFALLATLGLAIIYTGISLIIKELLIPIGKQAKAALLGAGVTLLVIVGLTAVVVALGALLKIPGMKKIMAEGAVALAVLGALMWELGKVSKTFAIGAATLYNLNNGGPLKGGPVEMGGLLMVEILTAVGLIVTALGALLKIPGFKKIMTQGSLAAAAIGLVADILAGEFLLYALAMGEVYKIGLEQIKDSSILLGEVFGAFGVAFAALGAIAMIPGAVEIVAAGELLAGIIGLGADIVAGEFLLFSKAAREIYDLNTNGEVLKGTEFIADILGALSDVVWALAKMALLTGPAAIGSAVLAALSPIILGMSNIVIPKYIGIMKMLENVGKQYLLDNSGKLLMVFDFVYKVVDKICPSVGQGLDLLGAAAAIVPLTGIFVGFSYIVDKILEINSKITVEDMHTFCDIVIGSKDNKENSLLGAIQNIVKGFDEISTLGIIGAALISKVIQPIIDTISKWIDVIIKVATMSYVCGYDDNGNPMYEHIEPGVFKDAATAVTTGFTEFLQSLNDGFKGLDPISMAINALTAKTIKPIIDVISKWIDVIMKVATGTYITGYDENGNPEFEHMDAKMFSDAAEAVTTRFSEFLQSLNKGMEQLSIEAILTMTAIQSSLGPIMTSVGSFVDAVIKVATLQIVTGYDENGNPELEQLDKEEFFNAGITLAGLFEVFIKRLGSAFEKLSITSIWAINVLGKTMSPLMDGVSKFVDAILKLASGQYIDSYTTDDKGNQIPHFTKIEKEEYSKAAEVISTNFGEFVDGITKNFDGGFWYSRTENALEALADNIGPIMDAVSKYTDAILNVATGTYIDHMEKDNEGKLQPYYKKIPEGSFEKAATVVAHSFANFVDKLLVELAKEDLIKKAKQVEDMIKDTISPIMDAVNKYSDALKPFISMTTNDPNTAAQKSDYLCFDNDFITQLTDNIAKSFTNFVGTIVDEFCKDDNKKRYENIASTSKQINKALDHIEKAIKHFNNILKIFAPNNNDEENKNMELLLSAPTITPLIQSGMSSILNIVTIFTDDALKKTIATSKLLSNVFSNIKKSTEKYKELLDIFISIDNNENTNKTPAQLIEQFSTDVNTLITKAAELEIDITADSTLKLLKPLLKDYIRIATYCKTLNDIISGTENLSQGIVKFMGDLKLLTSPDMNKSIITNTGSIRLYTSRLKEFTNQIVNTTKTVNIYVTGLNKAKKALESLDNQIISKANKRNKALEDLANRINAIANAVDNMRDAFEALDENAIISRFEGVKELLEAANISTQSGNTETGDQTGNTTQQSQRPIQRNPSRRTSVSMGGNDYTSQRPSRNNYNSNYPTSGTVIFHFQDSKLIGTYERR